MSAKTEAEQFSAPETPPRPDWLDAEKLLELADALEHDRALVKSVYIADRETGELLRRVAERLRAVGPPLCDVCRSLETGQLSTERQQFDPGNGCKNCSYQNHLTQLEARMQTVRDGWERECSDGDKIAQALGIKGHTRTEGGWLRMDKIIERIESLGAVGPRPEVEALMKAAQSAVVFLETVEWNDHTSESNAFDVRFELEAALRAVGEPAGEKK